MPRDHTDSGGDVPRTVQRSDEDAQEIWSDTHDTAVATYGEGDQAHRTAFSALMHSYKKDGDRWVRKEHDGASEQPAANDGGAKVDDGMTRDELYELAKQLDIRGRSKMHKKELAVAVHDADARR